VARTLPVCGALFALVLAVLVAYIRIGSQGNHSFELIWHELMRGPGGDGANVIVWQIRLPRGLMVALVGGLLGAVGSAFQALFRNPLADPYIVGVSSGAAVGGAAALLLGFADSLGGMGMILGGFVAALLSLLIVVALAQRRAVLDINSLLLAGVTVGTLLSAVLSLMLLMSGHDSTRVLSFLLGHTSDASWQKVAVLFPALVIGVGLLYRRTRELNVLAVNSATAQRLGVNVPGLTWFVLIVGTAMTAVAVSTVGIVGFVGLVAPHIARRLLGVDWRATFPAATLIGMVTMLVADLIAQRGINWFGGHLVTEVNVGIIAALIGAPSLLILMRKAG